jgi:hypothetical protein
MNGMLFIPQGTQLDASCIIAKEAFNRQTNNCRLCRTEIWMNYSNGSIANSSNLQQLYIITTLLQHHTKTYERIFIQLAAIA